MVVNLFSTECQPSAILYRKGISNISMTLVKVDNRGNCCFIRTSGKDKKIIGEWFSLVVNFHLINYHEMPTSRYMVMGRPQGKDLIFLGY